jgi:isoamyl acetate esterase
MSSFEGIPIEERSRVEEYIARINFVALRARADQCHKQWISQGNKDNVCGCSINPARFAAGSYNIVFEICFPDGLLWVARVWTNHFGLFDAEEKYISSSLQHEIQTMEYISDNSELPVPKVFDYDLDPQNPVQFRFIIMDALFGKPLGVPYCHIPRQYLETFLGQLAEYVVQLGMLSFSSIGSLQYDGSTRVAKIVPPQGKDSVYTTFSQFVHDLRSEQNVLLLKNEIFSFPEEDRELAGWVLLRAALCALKPQVMSGPFPLSHPDLHYNNILVDEKYNITGIIDWSGVTTVPQEVFAAIPGFRCPPVSDEGSAYSFCLELFIKALRQVEHKLVDQGSWLAVSDVVGSNMGECLNKALEGGMPWRGVPYAKHLLRFVFGEAATWDSVQKDFRSFEEVDLSGHIDLIRL